MKKKTNGNLLKIRRRSLHELVEILTTFQYGVSRQTHQKPLDILECALSVYGRMLVKNQRSLSGLMKSLIKKFQDPWYCLQAFFQYECVDNVLFRIVRVCYSTWRYHSKGLSTGVHHRDVFVPSVPARVCWSKGTIVSVLYSSRPPETTLWSAPLQSFSDG